MRVREAVDDIVGVVVTGGAVPVVHAGVGGKLDHAEGDGRSRERVPVSARADERVDPAGEVTRLGKRDQ